MPANSRKGKSCNKTVKKTDTSTYRKTDTSSWKDETVGQTSPLKPPAEFPPANGQVIVFMRYRRDMDRRMRNCIMKMKTRIRQPGTNGVILGVSDDVTVLEDSMGDWGDRHQEWGIAAFLFPNEACANLWYISEPELRQPDFLPPTSGVKLFAMKLRYLPQPGKNTYHWQEFHHIQSKSMLQTGYVDEVTQLLDNYQVNHGLVWIPNPSESRDQFFRLKESWIPYNKEDTYVVLNVFDDAQQFNAIYNSQEYNALQQRRLNACESVGVVFSINPDVTGPPCFTVEQGEKPHW